jgi:hypothetical protein
MSELTDLEHQATYTIQNDRYRLGTEVSVYMAHKLPSYKSYDNAETVMAEAEKLLRDNPKSTAFEIYAKTEQERQRQARSTPPIYLAFWNRQRILKTDHMPTKKEIEKALKDFAI